MRRARRRRFRITAAELRTTRDTLGFIAAMSWRVTGSDQLIFALGIGPAV